MTEQPQRVLIVEQDRVEAGLLAFHLRHNGFRPLLVSNDQEARDAASWAAPHAIVCELRGDGIDGLRFARDLAGAATAFFLIKDRGLSVEEDLEALRLGIAQIFSKPVEPEHLMTALRRAPRRPLGPLTSELADNEIAGSFQDISPVDLGRMWTRHKLDARLRVLPAGAARDAPATGELLIREGAIIAARHGALEGREAASALLEATDDVFVLELLTPDAPALRRRDEVNADLTALLTQRMTGGEPTRHLALVVDNTASASRVAGSPEPEQRPPTSDESAAPRLPSLPDARAPYTADAEGEGPSHGQSELRIPPPLYSPGQDSDARAAGRPRSRARRQTPTKPRTGARRRDHVQDDSRTTQPTPEPPLRPTTANPPAVAPGTAEYAVVRLRDERRSPQPGLSRVGGSAAPEAERPWAERAPEEHAPARAERPTRRVRRRGGETMTPPDGLAPTTQPGLGGRTPTDQARPTAKGGGARVVSSGRGPRRPITQPGRPVRPTDMERSRRVHLAREDATIAPANHDDSEPGFEPDAPVEITSSGLSERLPRRPRRFPGPPPGIRPPGTPGLRAPALAQTEDIAALTASPEADRLGLGPLPTSVRSGDAARRQRPSLPGEVPAEDDAPQDSLANAPAATPDRPEPPPKQLPEPRGEEARGENENEDDEGEAGAPADAGATLNGDEGEDGNQDEDDRGEGEDDEGEGEGDEGDDEGDEGDEGEGDEGDEDDDDDPEAYAPARAGANPTAEHEQAHEALTPRREAARSATSWASDGGTVDDDERRPTRLVAPVFPAGARPQRRLRRTGDGPARTTDGARSADTTETPRKPVTRVDLFDVADGQPQEEAEGARGVGQGAPAGRGWAVTIVLLAALWLALVAFVAVRLASRPAATPAGLPTGPATAAAPRATDPVDVAYEDATRRAAAGDTDGAIGGLREVLRQRPAHGPARARLAVLLFDAQRFGQALPLLQRIASDHPDDPAVLWHLGHVYQALGDVDRARAAWTRYLTVAPAGAPQRTSVERLLRAAGDAR